MIGWRLQLIALALAAFGCLMRPSIALAADQLSFAMEAQAKQQAKHELELRIRRARKELLEDYFPTPENGRRPNIDKNSDEYKAFKVRWEGKKQEVVRDFEAAAAERQRLIDNTGVNKTRNRLRQEEEKLLRHHETKLEKWESELPKKEPKDLYDADGQLNEQSKHYDEYLKFRKGYEADLDALHVRWERKNKQRYDNNKNLLKEAGLSRKRINQLLEKPNNIYSDFDVTGLTEKEMRSVKNVMDRRNKAALETGRSPEHLYEDLSDRMKTHDTDTSFWKVESAPQIGSEAHHAKLIHDSDSFSDKFPTKKGRQANFGQLSDDVLGVYTSHAGKFADAFNPGHKADFATAAKSLQKSIDTVDGKPKDGAPKDELYEKVKEVRTRKPLEKTLQTFGMKPKQKAEVMRKFAKDMHVKMVSVGQQARLKSEEAIQKLTSQLDTAKADGELDRARVLKKEIFDRNLEIETSLGNFANRHPDFIAAIKGDVDSYIPNLNEHGDVVVSNTGTRNNSERDYNLIKAERHAAVNFADQEYLGGKAGMDKLGKRLARVGSLSGLALAVIDTHDLVSRGTDEALKNKEKDDSDLKTNSLALLYSYIYMTGIPDVSKALTAAGVNLRKEIKEAEEAKGSDLSPGERMLNPYEFSKIFVPKLAKAGGQLLWGMTVGLVQGVAESAEKWEWTGRKNIGAMEGDATLIQSKAAKFRLLKINALNNQRKALNSFYIESSGNNDPVIKPLTGRLTGDTVGTKTRPGKKSTVKTATKSTGITSGKRKPGTSTSGSGSGSAGAGTSVAAIMNELLTVQEQIRKGKEQARLSEDEAQRQKELRAALQVRRKAALQCHKYAREIKRADQQYRLASRKQSAWLNGIFKKIKDEGNRLVSEITEIDERMDAIKKNKPITTTSRRNYDALREQRRKNQKELKPYLNFSKLMGAVQNKDCGGRAVLIASSPAARANGFTSSEAGKFCTELATAGRAISGLRNQLNSEKCLTDDGNSLAPWVSVALTGGSSRGSVKQGSGEGRKYYTVQCQRETPFPGCPVGSPNFYRTWASSKEEAIRISNAEPLYQNCSRAVEGDVMLTYCVTGKDGKGRIIKGAGKSRQ